MAAVRTPIARAGLNNYNHDIDDPEFQKTANIRRVAHRQVDILEIFGDHPKYHTQSGTSHEDITVSNQFKYFRKEMIELALVSGVTVPMDILEDNSGKILDFVRHAGPKFAIDLLQNETENIRLLRVTLSLLLIVITFLRRRLLGQLTSMLENVTLDSLLAWSAHALLDVADGVAISAGVNLLLHTHVEDIHILAFDLLVHVISVSEDAARQLLLPPNSYKYETGTHEREDSKSKASLLSASPAHSKLGDSNKKSFSGKNLFGEIDSQPSMSSPTGHPKSPSAMTATLPHRDHNTCLSYMLSICALYRNRLVVVSSCAEVIITLVCGSGDHLVAETIAKTPTCYLPSSLKDSHSGSKRVGVRNSSSSSQPKQYGVIHHSKHEEERVSSYGIVEWAGLKLMLKMLVRLVKCMSQDGEAIGHKEPATNSAAQDYSDLSPVSGQQPNVPRTHKKVLIAVLALIHYSRAVANYTLALPGAENIIKTSAAFYKSSSSITNWYQKGLTAFHNAREEKRLAAAAVAARAAALTAHKQSITANAVPLSGIKTVGSNSGGNSINDDGSIWSRSLESVEAGKSMAKSPQDHRHSASGLVPGAHSKRSRGQTYHEGKAPDGYFTRVGRPTSQHVLNTSSNISSHSSNNDLLRSTGETALAQSHRPYTAPNPQSGRPLGSVNKGSGLEWSHFDRLSESANLGIPAMQGACFGNFLKSLPGIPKIPGRTSAVSILAAGDEVVYEASVETKELFDAIASKELRKIENKGYMVNGKGNIPLEDRFKLNMTRFPIELPEFSNKSKVLAGSTSSALSSKLLSRLPKGSAQTHDAGAYSTSLAEGSGDAPLVFSSSQVYGLRVDGTDDEFPTIQNDFAPIHNLNLSSQPTRALSLAPRVGEAKTATFARPLQGGVEVLEEDDDDDATTLTAPSIFHGLDGGRGVFGGDAMAGEAGGVADTYKSTRGGTDRNRTFIGFEDNDSASVVGMRGTSQLNQLTSHTDEIVFG